MIILAKHFLLGNVFYIIPRFSVHTYGYNQLVLSLASTHFISQHRKHLNYRINYIIKFNEYWKVSIVIWYQLLILYTKTILIRI